MKWPSTLAIQAAHHRQLQGHLFPGDGLEAAAILICRRTSIERTRYISLEVIPIPHGECVRTTTRVTWPGELIERAIEQGERQKAVIFLVHSHPMGTPEFSSIDDHSDRETMNALFNAFGDAHGSAIMLPSGEIIARIYDAQINQEAVELVTVAENDIHLWWHSSPGSRRGERQPMAFSSNMARDLNALTATLIGVSGTGSIVGEQLARGGFGKIVAIDFDRVEAKNLNRILNSTTADAESNELKVQVFSRSVASHRSDCQVVAIEDSVSTRNAVEAAACGDIIFCCVDSYEARMVADRIASAFLIPLIDVGVSIPTHSAPGQPAAITDVCGRVDYVYPGGSTLSDRGVYTPERLAAEALMVSDPDSYRDQLEAGYFRGTIEEAPAVISLNMTAASIAFNEFLARTFPFRQECNAPYAQTRFSMADYSLILSEEDDFDRSENPILGRGSQPPLLNLPKLG